MSDSAKRTSGRKRKEVNYNEEKIVASFESDDEGGGGAAAAKKGRSSFLTPKVLQGTKPLPSRKPDGTYHFADHPEFKPNLSPKEVLQLGSFGGTYYRAIYSSVTQTQYDDKQWQEFPKDWFEGLDIKKQVTSKTYRPEMNKYGVKCGGDLNMWESSGWISTIDPYGWFQWYCRFYLGRRSEDDARQIGRANALMGPKGRFRNQLCNMIARNGRQFDDFNISPVIRQTLQHWGYVLTESDFQKHCKAKGFK